MLYKFEFSETRLLWNSRISMQCISKILSPKLLISLLEGSSPEIISGAGLTVRNSRKLGVPVSLTNIFYNGG